jgi:hypothetical protein
LEARVSPRVGAEGLGCFAFAAFEGCEYIESLCMRNSRVEINTELAEDTASTEFLEWMAVVPPAAAPNFSRWVLLEESPE